MLTAHIGNDEIIPFESVEFIEKGSEGCFIVHMAESKKEVSVQPPKAKEFIDEYCDYLELKQRMMGIIYDGGDEDEVPRPTRKSTTE